MKNHTAILLFVIASAAPAGAALAADAKTVQYFKETCGICHGENGEGIPLLAPALKGSKFVADSDIKAIAETITKGRQGDQKVYKEFASPMPAQSISSKKLQELIDYLRGELQS